jgi:hypothetical protein
MLEVGSSAGCSQRWGQVLIHVPANHLKADETFAVTITNESDDAISVCAGGLWRGAKRANPSTDYDPLEPEKWDGRKWTVVRHDADRMYTFTPQTLQAKASKEFQVRLNSKGQMRFEMLYLEGDKNACETRDNLKTADSVSFMLE